MDHFYWVIGFVGALAVGGILYLITGRKNREKSEYDERQQIARKTAITLAYTVLMVYLAAWMVLNALEIPFFRTPASIFIGMMLSATVFAIYAVFHDAYYSVLTRNSGFPVIFLLMGLTCVISGIRGRQGDAVPGTGESPFDLSLIAGACILVLVICVLIRRHMNKKAEAEAKDE